MVKQILAGLPVREHQHITRLKVSGFPRSTKAARDLARILREPAASLEVLLFHVHAAVRVLKMTEPKGT